MDHVTFLGYVILIDDISRDPSKVKVILQWQRPKRAKEVLSFLGLTSYYR